MMDEPGGSGREKGFPWRWREEKFWLFVEEETKESARGKELPMIHYSYPDNSNKWGGGRRQRATGWKERTNENLMKR